MSCVTEWLMQQELLVKITKGFCSTKRFTTSIAYNLEYW
ncbi:hypothetical protein SOVF_026270 [Spinacia oleracea]|nr:hypothetical protein SOVF_026270 [Spinacia oleracea]